MISHITLRRNLHLSLSHNCYKVPETVVACGIPLHENEDPSELGTAVTEARAMAPVGNCALKQPSTVYGSSNINIKAACTTWKSTPMLHHATSLQVSSCSVIVG